MSDDKHGVEAMDQLFQLGLEAVREGRPQFAEAADGKTRYTVNSTVDDLVDTLVLHLETVGLTRSMAAVLAGFLRKSTSAQRWEVLGLSAAHRRAAVAGQREASILAYAEAIRIGLSIEGALERAYNAYFAASSDPQTAGATMRLDSEQARGKKTLADQRMRTLVKPTLVKFGLIAPAPRGRPKKMKKN